MLTTPTAKIQEPKDFGQRIAVEYWRKTSHVFSSQGRDNPNCGLCLLPAVGDHSCAAAANPGSGPDCGPSCVNFHRDAEPFPAKPTFTEIVDRSMRPGVYSFDGVLSCGHGPVHLAVLPKQCPKVGDPYDCWDCERPVRERNQPGLPEDLRAEIEAQLPKCPECGGPIAKIPFIKRTVHKLYAEVHSQTGEIAASSERDDELEESPDWHISRYVQGEPVRELEVECAKGHSWFETRLAYKYDYRLNEHVWRVLPPTEKAPEPELVLERLPNGECAWLRPVS